MGQQPHAEPEPPAGSSAEPGLPPDRSVGHLLRDANRAFQRRLSVRITPLGVPLGHWYVFRVLWQQDGLSQADIAQRAGISTPTTMMVLQALQRARHVKRSPDPADRRKNVVYLTRSGRALEAPCLARARAINESATRGLSSDDIETLMRLLRAARENLGEDDLFAEEPVPALDPETIADEGP